MGRTDAEYILMGKIYEKQQELVALTEQLSSFGNVPEQDTPQEVVPQQDNLRQADPPELPQAAPSSPPLTAISDLLKVPSLDLVVKKSNFTRKVIPMEKKLHLVDNDHAIAASVSSGNSVNARSKSSRVLSWSNGRKYDPTSGKILRIRTALRSRDMSIRDLAGQTGLALDNVRDYIKEMDRQGFFTNT